MLSPFASKLVALKVPVPSRLAFASVSLPELVLNVPKSIVDPVTFKGVVAPNTPAVPASTVLPLVTKRLPVVARVLESFTVPVFPADPTVTDLLFVVQAPWKSIVPPVAA